MRHSSQLLVFLLGMFIASIATGQDFDRHPDMPFHPVALDWKLDMDAEYGGFESSATFTFRSNREDALQIVLRHRDLEILSVKSTGEEIPFVYNAEDLTISLPEPPAKGSEFDISIEYRAYPVYGFFMESDGSVWTSGMTGALSSVLPHLDHPRIRVRTNITIVHDAEFQAIANGTFTSRSSPDANRVTTVFRSRVPLPLSSLRFAVGRYSVSEVKSGNIPVRVYVSGMMDGDVSINDLRSAAVAEIGRASAELKAPYPFEAFTVIIQPFSYAEAWGDAAGMAWIFSEYGSSLSQLKLATASQWFGQGLAGLSNRDRFYLSGYARQLAKIQESFSSDVAELSGQDLGVDVRSLMAQHFAGMPTAEFALDDARGLLWALPGIVGTQELQDARYLSEMRPKNLSFPMKISRRVEEDASSVEEKGRFHFRISRTDNPQLLKLEIIPQGNVETGEYLVEMKEHYVDTSFVQPIRFEEVGGEVELTVDTGILNVTLDLDGKPAQMVDKPLGFWLYQIRNAKEREERVEAAKALGALSSDPDLRMVIRDLERSETDPLVRAAFIVSLAANGVEVASVAGYKNMIDGNVPELRLAALQALSNFPGDSSAVDLLRNHFSKTASNEEREAAMQSLKVIASPEESASLMREFLQSGEADPSSLLQGLFDEGSIDQGIVMADSLISAGNSYDLRRRALEMLEKFDDDANAWQQRMPKLASDQDPRIRLRAIELSSFLEDQQRDILLRDRQAKEADPRVKARLASF